MKVEVSRYHRGELDIEGYGKVLLSRPMSGPDDAAMEAAEFIAQAVKFYNAHLHAPKSDPHRVWELVDATDEEQYHTLGLFTSVERAREMACREDAPRYLPDAQELVRFEIRTRGLDQFDHPGWETIEVWTWVEEFGDMGPVWSIRPTGN